jgi:Holliday junction resolvase RusA-like endonuclease
VSEPLPLRLTVPLPPSTNNLYTRGRGHGRRVLTDVARAYKEEVALLAIVTSRAIQWRYSKGERLAFSLVLHFPNRRRHDLDNALKAPLDALAAALGFDDSCIDRITVERGEVDKANPRGELTLEKLSGAQWVSAQKSTRRGAMGGGVKG